MTRVRRHACPAVPEEASFQTAPSRSIDRKRDRGPPIDDARSDRVFSFISPSPPFETKCSTPTSCPQLSACSGHVHVFAWAHADRCRAARARSRLIDAEGAVSHRPPACGRRGARDDVAGGGRGAAAAEGRCVFRRVASARFLRRFSFDPRVERVDRRVRPGRRRGASRRAVARARLDRRPERGRYRAGSDVAALGLTLGPPLPVPPRRAFIFPPRVPRYLRAQASSRTPLCACFEPSGVS